jgi:alkanesulfonate monooxygenase SsuD/methylene tetrahydromethanopterin reductase-like flavin-dependent oxidoreductase (luciferase family)
LQKPHPPVYVVAVSPETMAFAARKGYSAFLPGIQSLVDLRETAAVYWQTFHEAGHNGRPAGLAVNRFVYVADSDARARREIRQPFLSFIAERAPDLKAALLRKYETEARLCFDRFLEDFCLFGSPESVSARIEEFQDRAGLTYLLCSLNLITLDHARCIRSMALFAREVMPRFTPGARERRPQGVRA